MSMSEELQKHKDVKPDKWILSWWDSQWKEVMLGYRGANHGINRALALIEDIIAENKLLRERIHTLETAADLDRAKIGQLQERMDKASEIVAQLKKTKEKP